MSFINILRVMRARFLVKLKIYFRYPLNFFYFIVDPLIWISPFYFMGKLFGDAAGFKSFTGSSNYMGFLILGYVLSSYSSAAMWAVGFSMKDEMLDGVLESNWTAPVNRSLLVLSNSLFEYLRVTIEIIVTSIVCHYVFGFTINNELMKSAIYLVPSIIALMGFGLIMASAVLLLKNANTIVDLSNSLIMGFSGGFFPIQMIGKYLLPISLAIPLTYLNDSIRALLISQTPFMELKYQLLILCGFMIAFPILGHTIFMKVEKRCRERGLSGY